MARLSAPCVMSGSAGAESLVLVSLSAVDTSMSKLTHIYKLLFPRLGLMFYSLPRRGSNLQEESNVCVFSLVPPPLHHSNPDLRPQLEAQKLPAGRTKIPDGGSGNAEPSASAQRSRAAVFYCSLSNQI